MCKKSRERRTRTKIRVTNVQILPVFFYVYFAIGVDLSHPVPNRRRKVSGKGKAFAGFRFCATRYQVKQGQHQWKSVRIGHYCRQTYSGGFDSLSKGGEQYFLIFIYTYVLAYIFMF